MFSMLTTARVGAIQVKSRRGARRATRRAGRGKPANDQEALVHARSAPNCQQRRGRVSVRAVRGAPSTARSTGPRLRNIRTVHSMLWQLPVHATC